MGSLMSTKHEGRADVSDNEYSSSSDMESENDYIAVDAAKATVPIHKNPSEARHLSLNPITDAEIVEIENNLEFYEKVSITYILYDDPQTAYPLLMKLLTDKNRKVVKEWVQHEKNIVNNKWQEKLLEALTVLQNYKVLQKLRFSKDTMYTRFLPLVKTVSRFINPVRKCLYRICEDFTKQDTWKFLTYVRKDLDYTINENSYLEIYLSYFETIKYISCDKSNNDLDLEKLIKICKYMEMDCLQKDLQSFSLEKVEQKPGCNQEQASTSRLSEQNGTDSGSESNDDRFDLEEFLNIDKAPGSVREKKTKRSKKQMKSQPETHSEHKNDVGTVVDNKYQIDAGSPGILIIINNEFFYSEFRIDLKDLLPSPDQLEQRKGTEQDKEMLKSTFEQLNFKVVCFENLNHEDILSNIKKEVAEIHKESSLFIAILSHGDQGIVYGSNSIGVKVTEIQNIMCKGILAGKPKVLILQSCQGSECQDLNNKSDEFATDGPLNVLSVPKTADFLVFWATVPGYGAIRHKKTGSWFIQTLCKKILDKQTSHFEDICIFVKNEVTNLRWKQKVMVPLVESTFSKFLFLPSLKINNVQII